ncbi:MAG: hypothetical protein IT207_01975 [Fimbriimonadaceae bacterium]|nr:hypothetical protein [Fimbriimonadaceae bacterium]
MACTGFGQTWSRTQAVDTAIEIATAWGDGPRDRLVPDEVSYRPPSDPLLFPPGRGTWSVFFGSTIVMVSDGGAVRYSWSGPDAAQVESTPVAPFDPFRRTGQEWVEHGRTITRSKGFPELREFVAIESKFPVPNDEGKYRTRPVYLTLNQPGPVFATLTGGNHIDLGLDATNGKPFSASVQTGFTFEPTPSRLVSEADALDTLRAAVNLGELIEVRGPVYAELLGRGDLTAEGRTYKEHSSLPLVYSITGARFHGAVSAVTGKVLRTRNREGLGRTHSEGIASSDRSPVASNPRSRPSQRSAEGGAHGIIPVAAGILIMVAGASWIVMKRSAKGPPRAS